MTAAEPAASQCLAVPKGSVYVGFREGGERAKPSGRGHSQTLKKLLQEYGLEPWLRDSVPLVYAGDTLIAVGDLWVCDGWQPEAGQSAMVLRWTLSVAE